MSKTIIKPLSNISSVFDPLERIFRSHLIYLTLVSALLSIGTIRVFASEPNPLSRKDILENLDRKLRDQDIYTAKRVAHADSITAELRHTRNHQDRIQLYWKLALVQSGFSTDSAIATLNRGLELSISERDTVMAQRFILFRARELFFSGQVTDAIADLIHVESKGVRPEVYRQFHGTGVIIYYTLEPFNQFKGVHSDYYTEGKRHALKSLELLEPDTAAYYVTEALMYMGDGNTSQMLASLHKALAVVKRSDPEYHMVHVLLGEMYRYIHNTDESVYHYAMAAVADIENAALDEVALLRLGEYLNELGDKSRGYDYLSKSLSRAVQCNAKFNLMRVNNVLVMLSREMNKERSARMRNLTITIIIFAILLVIMVILERKRRLEVKRLRQTEARLGRANLAKVTYVHEFINLCADSAEYLEEYNNLCRRKIMGGHSDELLDYIQSGAAIEQQRKKFYEVFDTSFLNLFPGFMDGINALLQPDKRITLPADNVLTTELRVAAFSRLGIDDANMIARFLGITMNTVYTYRNKLRSRAVNRNTFEEDMMKIGAV